MTLEIERRFLSRPIELREETGGVRVEGYAALFDTPTNIGDVFIERIAPGAFDNTLARGDDVEFLINHGGLPLARTTAGNLKLSVDDVGLRMAAVLDPADPDVQRIVPKMRQRGQLDQMSFAFTAAAQRWDDSADGISVRTVLDVILYDVSIVNRGAYPDTSIALRARDAAKDEEEAQRLQDREQQKQHNQAGWLRRKAQQEQRIRGI